MTNRSEEDADKAHAEIRAMPRGALYVGEAVDDDLSVYLMSTRFADLHEALGSDEGTPTIVIEHSDLTVAFDDTTVDGRVGVTLARLHLNAWGTWRADTAWRDLQCWCGSDAAKGVDEY